MAAVMPIKYSAKTVWWRQRTRSWMKLIAVSVATLLFTAAAGINILATVAAKARPDLSLLVSNNGVAASNAADAAVMSNNGEPTNASVALAQVALRRDPLSSAALRVLAIQALRRNDILKGLSLLRLSSQVTRRDPATQLMMIQESVERGDVRGTLTHYDYALRANPELGETLYPIMAAALSERTIADELEMQLRRSPPWRFGFLDQAVRSGDSRAVANLFLRLGNLPTTDNYTAIQSALVDRLIVDQAFGVARELYRHFPNGNEARWTSLGIVPSDANLTDPAGWRVLNESFFESQLLADDRGSVFLRVSMPSGQKAVVIYKILMLKPGIYRPGISASRPLPPGASLAWSLHCPSTATKPTAWNSVGDLENGRDVKIDATCPAQSLQLTVEGGVQGVERDVATPTLRLIGNSPTDDKGG